MQRVTKRFAILAAPTLMVALWGVSSPMDARGQIKQLTIGIAIDADTLNPQEHTTMLMQNMCALLYDTYLYLTPEGKLEPRLVTKYEVSPDGLTWTLHLRQGVKFSDGTPFNAKAVKLSFDRTLDPKLRVPLRFAITCVNECVVVDDSTIQLKLKYPFAQVIEKYFGGGCFTCPGINMETIAFASTMHNLDPEKIVDEIKKLMEK